MEITKEDILKSGAPTLYAFLLLRFGKVLGTFLVIIAFLIRPVLFTGIIIPASTIFFSSNIALATVAMLTFVVSCFYSYKNIFVIHPSKLPASYCEIKSNSSIVYDPVLRWEDNPLNPASIYYVGDIKDPFNKH